MLRRFLRTLAEPGGPEETADQARDLVLDLDDKSVRWLRNNPRLAEHLKNIAPSIRALRLAEQAKLGSHKQEPVQNRERGHARAPEVWRVGKRHFIDTKQRAKAAGSTVKNGVAVLPGGAGLFVVTFESLLKLRKQRQRLRIGR